MDLFCPTKHAKLHPKTIAIIASALKFATSPFSWKSQGPFLTLSSRVPLLKVLSPIALEDEMHHTQNIACQGNAACEDQMFRIDSLLKSKRNSMPARVCQTHFFPGIFERDMSLKSSSILDVYNLFDKIIYNRIRKDMKLEMKLEVNIWATEIPTKTHVKLGWLQLLPV